MNVAVGNPFGYSDAVWSRFVSSPGAGTLPPELAGWRQATARSRAADIELELTLAVAADGGVAAAFRAHGCPTTIAVGQWLVERAQALPWSEFAALRAADMVAALEIAPHRLHCALLGEDVIAALAKPLLTR